MPRLRYSSNHGRNPVRLLSTPKGTTVTTTVANQKFSDQLAALLVHAMEHGFRIEPDTKNKRSSNAVVVYAPNKDVPPIHVSEVKSKHNPAHTDNIRRQLERAGMPPMGAPSEKDIAAEVAGDPGSFLVDQQFAEAKHAAHTGAGDLTDIIATEGRDIAAVLANPDEAPAFIGAVVFSMCETAGLGKAEADLVSTQTITSFMWAARFSGDRLTASVTDAVAAAEQRLQGEVSEALALAAQHEGTADRATKALKRAEDSEQKAREDCAAALRRAEAAEAKARELEAAIAPLRAVLAVPTATD